jgi:hypothetical protein
MAAVVVIITSMVVANATQSLTTPNAAFVSYNLAASANSAPIGLATNRSVQVMGCCTTPNTTAGVGQVSLIHIPSTDVRWVGLESPSNSASTITSGHGSTGHIVYIDFNHYVEIQVASADTIRVHNGLGVSATGNVTLIW